MPSACPHCNKLFQRPEHLKRHVGAVHEREGKEYACRTCGKTFSRSDSCLRHERNHATPSGVIMLEHGRRTLRACENCALARTKCDGDNQCSRCRTRQLACVYNNRRPKKVSGEATQYQSAPVPLALPETSSSYSSFPPAIDGPVQAPLETQQTDAFFTSPGQIQQAPAAFDADMDLFWPDNMNWLPVGNDADFFALSSTDFTALWDPFRSSEPGMSTQMVNTVTSPYAEDHVTVGNGAMVSPISSTSISTPSSGSRARARRLSRYVDGQGARGSLQNRSREPHDSIERHAYDSASGLPAILEFPDNTDQDLDPSQRDVSASITVERYVEIREWFNTLVTNTCQTFAPQLLTTHFPSHEYFGHCFELYMQHVQHEWPIVHHTAWIDGSAAWFLLLAAVTVGASRKTSETGQRSCVTFLEFLRRALHYIEESGEDRGSLAVAQASMLHVIATAQLPEKMLTARISTAVAGLRLAVLALPNIEDMCGGVVAADVQHSQDSWKSWVIVETQRRIMLLEWQLRLLLAVSLDVTEHPGMPAYHFILPSSSTCWEADDTATWMAAVQHKRPRRLWSALETLYTAHSVDNDLDATSQCLLVYAVIGRTQEVSHLLQQPLRQWSPAPGEDSSNDGKADEVLQTVGWLPSHPQFAAWRNSACDCLDTLHWKANSEIATAKGLEGPIILHLHLARLILLCPYKALTQLAADIAQVPFKHYGVSVGTHNSSQPFNTTIAGKRACDATAKWITFDDHKQRLSLVHAGAIFWHIRRYSKGSFTEPFAIFIAALAIWFTGCFQPSLQASLLENKARLAEQRNEASRPRNVNRQASTQTAAGSDEENDDTVPTSILLDRPCDDEIVQTFVRRGHNMEVKMSGAGQIDTAYGMRRVLQEGVKLLKYAHYANNARCTEYERILDGLARKSHTARSECI